MVKSNKLDTSAEIRSARNRKIFAFVVVIVFAVALVNVLNIKKENSMVGDSYVSEVQDGGSLTGATHGDSGTTILWGNDAGEKCKRAGWQGGYTYKLTRSFGVNDLDSTTKSCFLINSQNVVLDCNGFGITGYVRTSGSKGVEITSNGVVLKNCAWINNFDYSIYLFKQNTNVDNVQILANKNIYNNNVGIYFGKFARYATVNDNEIRSNLDTGIKFVGGNKNNIISNTISCRNTNYDVGFFCAPNYPCQGTSGATNYFSTIKPDDGSPNDYWPVLGQDYQLCSAIQCNNGADDDGDTKVDYKQDSKCSGTTDFDESPKDNCIDTDGGTMPLTAGSVSGWNNDALFGPYADYCIDSTQLNEYYCGSLQQDYDWFSRQINCYNVTGPVGWRCVNGACVPP